MGLVSGTDIDRGYHNNARVRASDAVENGAGCATGVSIVGEGGRAIVTRCLEICPGPLESQTKSR
jgi:hypothetical protein